ncbi:MAG: hypothetical protein QXP42_06025 [Candidatus Micrarchaeia archaeon]
MVLTVGAGTKNAEKEGDREYIRQERQKFYVICRENSTIDGIAREIGGDLDHWKNLARKLGEYGDKYGASYINDVVARVEKFMQQQSGNALANAAPAVDDNARSIERKIGGGLVRASTEEGKIVLLVLDERGEKVGSFTVPNEGGVYKFGDAEISVKLGENGAVKVSVSYAGETKEYETNLSADNELRIYLEKDIPCVTHSKVNEEEAIRDFKEYKMEQELASAIMCLGVQQSDAMALADAIIRGEEKEWKSENPTDSGVVAKINEFLSEYGMGFVVSVNGDTWTVAKAESAGRQVEAEATEVKVLEGIENSECTVIAGGRLQAYIGGGWKYAEAHDLDANMDAIAEHILSRRDEMSSFFFYRDGDLICCVAYDKDGRVVEGSYLRMDEETAKGFYHALTGSELDTSKVRGTQESVLYLVSQNKQVGDWATAEERAEKLIGGEPNFREVAIASSPGNMSVGLYTAGGKETRVGVSDEKMLEEVLTIMLQRRQLGADETVIIKASPDLDERIKRAVEAAGLECEVTTSDGISTFIVRQKKVEGGGGAQAVQAEAPAELNEAAKEIYNAIMKVAEEVTATGPVVLPVPPTISDEDLRAAVDAANKALGGKKIARVVYDEETQAKMIVVMEIEAESPAEGGTTEQAIKADVTGFEVKVNEAKRNEEQLTKEIERYRGLVGREKILYENEMPGIALLCEYLDKNPDLRSTNADKAIVGVVAQLDWKNLREEDIIAVVGGLDTAYKMLGSEIVGEDRFAIYVVISQWIKDGQPGGSVGLEMRLRGALAPVEVGNTVDTKSAPAPTAEAGRTAMERGSEPTEAEKAETKGFEEALIRIGMDDKQITSLVRLAYNGAAGDKVELNINPYQFFELSKILAEHPEFGLEAIPRPDGVVQVNKVVLVI